MNKTSEPLKVALIGAGTVGSQVARLLLEQAEEFAARIGRPIELAGIAVRDLSKSRPGIPTELLTDDVLGLVKRDDIDIVVELMGGVDPAYEYVMTAISHGKSVVTGNKALLSEYGQEIFKAADEANVDVYFEAAVAGAIPIVRPLRESLVGDQITSVTGIVNGTTNYILDKMTTEHMSYAEALAQAQELGYAEADPTADVTGADAAAKCAILASLSFHTPVNLKDVYCEGITEVTEREIKAAEENDCTVKLLAIAQLTDGVVHVRVHPSMVPNSHPLASVSGANNAIFVEAESAGRLMFMGPGAGGAPTASAVVGDLVTVSRNRTAGMSSSLLSGYRERPIADMGATRSRYYLELDVLDKPGVLASVAKELAAANVSIMSMRQIAGDGSSGTHAELGLVTHVATEENMLRCIDALRASDSVEDKIHWMRVEG